MIKPCESVGYATDEKTFSPDTAEVVEVPLLLSGWQMSALERAAYLRGLTAAEMVRQVLRDFIAEQSDWEEDEAI